MNEKLQGRTGIFGLWVVRIGRICESMLSLFRLGLQEKDDDPLLS